MALTLPRYHAAILRGPRTHSARVRSRDPVETEREAARRVALDDSLDQIVVDAIPDAQSFTRLRFGRELHEFAHAHRAVVRELLREPARDGGAVVDLDAERRCPGCPGLPALDLVAVAIAPAAYTSGATLRFGSAASR